MSMELCNLEYFIFMYYGSFCSKVMYYNNYTNNLSRSCKVNRAKSQSLLNMLDIPMISVTVYSAQWYFVKNMIGILFN